MNQLELCFQFQGFVDLEMANKTSKMREVRRGNYLANLFKRRLPILAWLPAYDSDKLVSDAIAGITVGLTVMPQGLAYATLAGLEPQVITNIIRLITRIAIIIFFFYIVLNSLN